MQNRSQFNRLSVGAAALSLLLAVPASLAFADNSGNGYVPARSSSGEHIASGTNVKVKLLQDISSDTAQPGDTVRVAVAADDSSGLPTGTVFTGRVVNARPATAKRPGILRLQLALPSRSYNGGYQQRADAGAPQNSTADDASVELTGRSEQRASNKATGIGAAAGALLGLSRKGKIGDTIEGGAIGALGGAAVDQASKHAAGDVSLKKGSEITVKLDRPMAVRTIVEPDENY